MAIAVCVTDHSDGLRDQVADSDESTEDSRAFKSLSAPECFGAFQLIVLFLCPTILLFSFTLAFCTFASFIVLKSGRLPRVG